MFLRWTDADGKHHDLPSVVAFRSDVEEGSLYTKSAGGDEAYQNPGTVVEVVVIEFGDWPELKVQ